VAAPADERRLVGIFALGDGTRRLPHSLCERHKIVVGRWGRTELTVVADEVPAAGGRQATGVGLAEVIRMRLGKRRERADDSRRLRVDIRQRRDGLPGTSVARASPWGPHGGTVSLHGPLPCAVGPRHAVLPDE
jgi:hypothetical protein